MSKHSSRSWLNIRQYVSKDLMLGRLACLIGIFMGIGNGVISATGLINLVINILRILFIAYLLFGMVQILKLPRKRKDRNT